ncbi:hypothetical protein H4R33_002638 [Dimargaris cristalligena]|nr:hypothetical protein H4R33_002638 [Dimargaris cristalligena]
MESTTLFGRLFGYRPPATAPPEQMTTTPPSPRSPAYPGMGPAGSLMKSHTAPTQQVQYTTIDDRAQRWNVQTPFRNPTATGSFFGFAAHGSNESGSFTTPTSNSHPAPRSIGHSHIAPAVRRGPPQLPHLPSMGSALGLIGTNGQPSPVYSDSPTASPRRIPGVVELDFVDVPLDSMGNATNRNHNNHVYSSSSQSTADRYRMQHPARHGTPSGGRNRSNSMLDLSGAAQLSTNGAEAHMAHLPHSPYHHQSQPHSASHDHRHHQQQQHGYIQSRGNEYPPSEAPAFTPSTGMAGPSLAHGLGSLHHGDQRPGVMGGFAHYYQTGGPETPPQAPIGAPTTAGPPIRSPVHPGLSITVPPRRCDSSEDDDGAELKPRPVPKTSPHHHPKSPSEYQAGLGQPTLSGVSDPTLSSRTNAHRATQSDVSPIPQHNTAASNHAPRYQLGGEEEFDEEDDDDDFDDDEDEDDDYVERDRYGFSKFNQYLSRDEYLRFEAQYGPIVEQRKIKWRQLFVGAGGQWPPRSTKVKRYIRKGIPSEIRGPCWFHYSGGAHKYRENPSTYRKWVKVYLREGRQSDFADIIERDLHRTFPDNEHFQMRLQAVRSDERHSTMLATGRGGVASGGSSGKAGGGGGSGNAQVPTSPLSPPLTANSGQGSPSPAIPNLEAKQKSCVDSLRRILNVFTLYCPHVGYNQSLSYIVGLLLLFLSEEQAFWMLVTIVEDLMPSGYFNLSQEYSLIDQEVLLSLLESKMPSVHRHLCREEPSPLGGSSGGGGSEGGPDILPPVFLAMSHWFPLLFVDVLPVESVLRVWDCFFYEGSKVLFRVALALFKLNETPLLQTRDSLEQFQLVHEFPKKMIHCHHLMQVCFGRAISLSRTDIGALRRQHYNRRKRRSMMLKLHKQHPPSLPQLQSSSSSGGHNGSHTVGQRQRPIQKAFASWRG